MKRPTHYELPDPVELATLDDERHEALFDLFQPIYEFDADLTTKWLIQDWIPQGSLIILAGAPKSGKTCLATALSLAIATGTPFAGLPTTQGSVLWLALEESRAERRYLINQHPLGVPSTPIYTCYEPLVINEATTLDALDYWIRQTDAKLIVVDPLQAAAPGSSLDHGHSARRALQDLKRFCQTRRVTALVLHHAKSPTRANPHPRVADHAQLSATASILMVMTVQESQLPVQSEIKNLKSEIPPTPNSELKPPNFEKSEIKNLKSSIPPNSELQTPNSPKSEIKNLKSEIPEFPPPNSEKSEIKNLKSSIPPTPNSGFQTPNFPRLISLFCQGRGHFANRTLHLRSTSPHEYHLADAADLKAAPEPVRPTLSTDLILDYLKITPADGPTLCHALKLNPYTLRNSLSLLRARGEVRSHLNPRGHHIYALASYSREQALAATLTPPTITDLANSEHDRTEGP